MKINCLVSFCLLACFYTFSQERFVPEPKYEHLFKVIPELKANEPKWVKMLYGTNPNYFEISNAYENFYANNVFEKNIHTQNFKYFSRVVNQEEYVMDDGSIYIPEITEKSEIDKRIFESRMFDNINKSKSAANWKPLGPFETFDSGGGRTRSSQVNIFSFDQSLSNPNVIYAGCGIGALFKSIDKGLNWIPVGDQVFNSAISSLEVDPTNENIVYVGSGNKLYKTMDGGENWSILLEVKRLSVKAITINPNNPKIILVAGGAGLRRSTDGGNNWSVIFEENCWDVKLKTDDPKTVFLAKNNNQKKITEIYKSTDNGQTFVLKNKGWFSPVGGVASNSGGARIGVSDADANRLYVVLLGNENDEVADSGYIGVYRSDNAAEDWFTPYDGNGDGMPDNEPGGPYNSRHWCLTSRNRNTGGYHQGFYNLDIEVSDTDPDRFMVGALNLFKSEDGGVSYRQWGGYGCQGCGPGYRHPDIQEIEINGKDVWVCSDGGLDYYDENFDRIAARNNGINGSNYWGFDQGWNHDVLVGGRYHNGNAAYYEDYGEGDFLFLGGGESATGYVNVGENRKVYHSDIPGKIIPEKFRGGVRSIGKYQMFPNESYFPAVRSEIVNDPRYWNVLYLGKENKLWRSNNGGASFVLVNEFGENSKDRLGAIEVSRNNPDVIFVTQKKEGKGILWKTTDAGNKWEQVEIPASHSYMLLSLNTNDELYLALNVGGNRTNKIFKSSDLGQSWDNLTTRSLDGETIKNIQIQEGTDGGVYISSSKVIWYRNNTHNDWQLFSDNLPVNLRVIKMLPFYKKGKIRIAGSRGIWESDFYEKSLPKAQPMVSKQKVFCSRTEVQFEDYSVLEHNGASWEWQFPGATTVSSTHVRNPIVTYSKVGSYEVTLTITDANGNSSTKTVKNMVTVENDFCQPESDPQMALMCSKTNQYAVNKTITEKGITNFSFTGWIKVDGVQTDYSSIFSLSSGSGNKKFALNFREGNNTLGIHWNGKFWKRDSNLKVPIGQWVYVAMTVSPTEVNLFVNEKQIKWSIKTSPFDLTSLFLGSFYGNKKRNFEGLIEEATFWKRTLTANEIMLSRHLVKKDISDPDLLAYYQFNHKVNRLIFDKKGTNDLIVKGKASLLNSDVPVGYGYSEIAYVDSGGEKKFGKADCLMNFREEGTYPNGKIVVTKIIDNPSAIPDSNIVDDSYWIINNYGDNQEFNTLSDITFTGIDNIDDNEDLKATLFQRNSNADSSVEWGESLELTGELDVANKSVVFVNSLEMKSFDGQFYVGGDSQLDLEDLTFQDFLIYPNPVRVGENLYIHNLKGTNIISVYDANGRNVFRKTIQGEMKEKIPVLQDGVYYYSIMSRTKIINGKIVINN